MSAMRLFLIALYCCSVVPATAQEWTRFRGPNGTGETECKTIPAEWSDKDVLWKAKVPGSGHSSPVIWGDKVFVFSADPDNATRYCLCYRVSDGKQLWSTEYKSKPHHLHPRSSFGSSTPAVDNERAYFAWSTPEETSLVALDHQGSEVWRKNLGRWVSQHGFGTSPILFGDLVILNNAQDDESPKTNEPPGESFMLAFDRKTGKEVWRTPLKAEVVSYSVPFIHELPGGKSEVI